MGGKVALQLRTLEPWAEMAGMMHRAGFRYVSIAFGDDEDNLTSDNWREYVENIDRVLKQNELKCVMTHAPYYSLMISAEQRDEKMELAMLRTVEATRILGAEICAVHPRSVLLPGVPALEATDRARSLEENLIAFAPLVEACERLGVKLGVENLMKYVTNPGLPPFYSYLVEDHIELIDKLNSESVCGVWDFGHANLCDEDHAERIRRIGGRIMGTHVHNNDAINDNHYPPFYPDASSYYVRRSIDWRAVMAALKDTGFDGYLTLETVFHFDFATEALVKYLYESVCALDDMVR